MGALVSLSEFLSRVEEIAAENPAYRTGGSGTDGTCDCVGLIMGAVRRAGGKWPWLHSSNDAARKGVTALEQIGKVSDLVPGEMVFKHLKPGDSGYDLPKRYAGDPDRNDYVHVGVVLSVNPLRIRHMTSPRVMLDSKLGKWSHHGWCTLIRKDPEAPREDQDEWKDGEKTVPEKVTIESTNGLPVKLRDKPSTSCSLYWEIPSGGNGVRLSREGDWSRVEVSDANGRIRTGWMKSEFVVPAAEENSGRSLSPEQLEAVLFALAEIQQLLDSVSEMLGGVG